MSMEITENTIENFYNLIRNWDVDAKRRLVNRINSSLDNECISINDLLSCLNEFDVVDQSEMAMIEDVRKN